MRKATLKQLLVGLLVVCAVTTVSAEELVRKAASRQVFTLDQAITYALANNPDVQIANERIGQADAQLGEALSAFYPQITAKVGYQHSNNPVQVFSMAVAQRQFDPASINSINSPGYRQNFRPEIMGKLSLFRGGQDYYQSKAAELGVAVAELEHAAMRNSLVEMVTATYYGYLAAIEAQKVANDSITAVTSELDQTRKQYVAGTALKADVLSLEVKLAEAQENQIRTANGIELALVSAKTLLGLATEESFSLLAPATLPVPALSTSFTELLNQALAQRPELQAAIKQVEMSERQIRGEQGAYLPRADAFVSYGQDSQDPGFSSSQDNVTAGVSVEMDLFSGFNTKNRVSAAERKAAQARETERKTRLNIEQDVKTAHLKLQEALARLRVTEASVSAADEALRLVNEQRRADTVTVTRYLEAEAARNKAHANTITAHYDALTAETALKQAIGELNQ
ncbi:MAG: TolC family protein [Methylobacter sp.]|nr:TolC family protein [Methylobacter sp.]